MKRRTVVAFRAGGVACAAEARDVMRILEPLDFLAAPAAPPWLLGLVRRGGVVQAAVDVGARLFPGAAERARPRFLLAGDFGGVPALLAVEDVEGVLDVLSSASSPPGGMPPSVARCMSGAVEAPAGVWRVLLDVPALLDVDREVILRAVGEGPAPGA